MTASSKPGRPQPESLTTFEKAAREEGRKPKRGLHADAETAPRPDDPRREHETARKVLEAGVEKKPHEATRAVQTSRDPRIPR
ncbi:hypothetical protein NK718_19545 [Alsobacter sp. SYSU M60028]|uniref:Uncharacterized protein n=1 Tax=Alsobacter ponti TaxID=2962936 RepID=A0ABT1LGU4_9HYPH|nr:hypothetical protein [Alsobacter ponti]MCP8940726.1 hypothetical protein [Alsobacter ponti]